MFSKQKTKRISAIMTVLLVILIIIPCALIYTQDTNKAEAYETLPTGAIDNLYDSEKGFFVKSNLNQLASKAGYKDISAMLQGVLSVLNNGKDINSRIFNEGTTVKLGTYYNLSTNQYEDLVWIPVYLSKDKSGKSVVLTLWLASVDTTEQASNQERSTWSDGTWTADYTKTQNGMVCNTYDGSYIRNVTLNNGGRYLGNWGSGTAVAPPDYTYPTDDKTKNKFVDFTTGALSGYIVSPSNVPWQMAQDYSPNDPLYDGSKNSGTATLGKADPSYYSQDWIEDKVWLPAFDDLYIISSTSWLDVRNLWNCSDAQKASYIPNDNNAEEGYKSYMCLRSGGQSYSTNHGYSLVEYLGCNLDGTIYRALDEIWRSTIVRPAIHLNLTAAVEDADISAPLDVSVEYTGEELDFTAVTTLPEWYNSDVMTIAFSDGATGKTDLGEYEMIATIKDDYADKGLKFKGDPADGESEISRKFKFTIIKKKIGATLTLGGDNRPIVTLDKDAVFSGDTQDNGRAPTFEFTYRHKVSGKEYDSYPEGEIGEYEAILKMTNDCNYVLAGTYKIDVKVSRTKVAKPSIATREKAYNGMEQEFRLSQVTDKVEITAPSGMTYDSLNGVVKATAAGEYKIRISLADNGKATCWEVAGGAEEISAFEIVVKITQIKLSPVVECSESDLSWEVGGSGTFSITDARIAGDEIEYYVYYLKSGDSTKYDAIDSKKVVDGGKVSVEIPSDLGIGGYEFVVELKKDVPTSDNGNYYIDGESKSVTFSIVGNGITVTANDVKWKVNNEAIGALENNKLPLTYNGKGYTFGVDEGNLKALGVKIDVSKGSNKGLDGDVTQTNVGVYKVTVWLCNYDDTYDKYSGSFTLNYEIKQGKYDMSSVKWNYVAGTLTYDKSVTHKVELTGLPSSLSVIADGYDGNEYKSAGEYTASVLGFKNSDGNYVTPIPNKPETYEGDFDWTLEWSIGKATLNIEWESVDSGNGFKIPQVTQAYREYIDKYIYTTSDGKEISIEEIEVGETLVRYWAEAVLTENTAKNYKLSEDSKKTSFRVGNGGEKVEVKLDASSFVYDGNAHGGELKVVEGTLELGSIIKKYYKVVDGEKIALGDGEMPTNAGDYVIELSLSESDESSYYLSETRIGFSIAKAKIKAEWDNSGSTPVIANLSAKQKEVVGYEYYDSDGNKLPDGAKLEKGKTYKIKAIIIGDNGENYEFVAEDGETVLDDPCATEATEFEAKGTSLSSGNNGIGTTVNFDDATRVLKEWWQVIASGISIVLIILFVGKTASYESRRKKAKKQKDEKYATFYAAVTGLFGLQMKAWTGIACGLMGMAVLSLIMMIVSKSRCQRAEEDLSESKDEYTKMMFMRMMNGNAQGMQQQAIGAEEMRMMINEAVTAMLPSVQQMLPQQASGNEEIVGKLIEKEEENDKLVKKLLEDNAKNQDTIKELMQKLTEQPERVVEKEVAATSANDELLKQLVDKSNKNDETISKLMEKIIELSAISKTETQIVEKIIEKPVEKVVEKVVEKPVEKIVEKEVRVEVPIEKVVEKVVEKDNTSSRPQRRDLNESKESKPKKAPAPRLTLAEAYAKLTKEQKKYFDGLREYAMKKDGKCKEKLATYFTTIGPSTTNPLIKLTIKKGITVALFKMEDEYLKDIRRNAGSDGTKVKVKETEVPIGDAQAFDTAKDMIDLRIDQIERYEDFLKEQKAMRRK